MTVVGMVTITASEYLRLINADAYCVEVWRRHETHPADPDRTEQHRLFAEWRRQCRAIEQQAQSPERSRHDWPLDACPDCADEQQAASHG